MPMPVLIDADMGIDDAIAITLALSARPLELAGLVSVGGNVPLDQATDNIGRLLTALKISSWPPVGRGLDQREGLMDATHVFGTDGLGETGLPVPDDYHPGSFIKVYEQCIETHGSALTIVAIGPLTNLAALLHERPGLLEKAGSIVVMGGAVWCPGNVNRWTEFNFYRDPRAAAEVMSAGLPVTLVPLDVTRQVALDESHVAHLSRSGRITGDVLARMIRWPLARRSEEAAPGRFIIHDALVVGTLLWPELFLRAKIGLEIVTGGEQAGRSKPAVTRDRNHQVHVVMSVNEVDFLENLLECLCQEEFVV